jgi:hypothetical protein
MTCSDLWAVHQRKCKEWQKGGSLVTDGWWNHYEWVQGTKLCKVYNYHDSQPCSYKWFGILFWLDGMVWFGMGLELFWYGYGMVLDQDDFWCSFVKLCDL